MYSGRKQLLELKGCLSLFCTYKEVHPAPHDKISVLQSSEADLCDLTTMAGWLPGFSVTHQIKQSGRATENFIITPPFHRLKAWDGKLSGWGLPHCPCGLVPQRSASVSDWTPQSSAPASGSPVPSWPPAPVEKDAHTFGKVALTKILVFFFLSGKTAYDLPVEAAPQ